MKQRSPDSPSRTTSSPACALGNSAGRPHDVASQVLTLELALRLLESAPEPRTTMESPLRWSESAEWKLDYCNAEQLSPEELKRLRTEFNRGKEAAREMRQSRLIA
jgi:D-proline reductase (dithiol) PrdB